MRGGKSGNGSLCCCWESKVNQIVQGGVDVEVRREGHYIVGGGGEGGSDGVGADGKTRRLVMRRIGGARGSSRRGENSGKVKLDKQ